MKRASWLTTLSSSLKKKTEKLTIITVQDDLEADFKKTSSNFVNFQRHSFRRIANTELSIMITDIGHDVTAIYVCVIVVYKYVIYQQ